MKPSVALMGKPLMLPCFAALKLQLPDPEPESSAVNEAATVQRQAALEEIGEYVLRNVAQAQAIQSAKYAAAHKRARDAGTASETLRAPIVGDYVLIRNLKKGKLQPAWESGIYHLVEYNRDETVATLEMTDGTRWTENVEQLKVYRGPSPAGF